MDTYKGRTLDDINLVPKYLYSGQARCIGTVDYHNRLVFRSDIEGHVNGTKSQESKDCTQNAGALEDKTSGTARQAGCKRREIDAEEE